MAAAMRHINAKMQILPHLAKTNYHAGNATYNRMHDKEVSIFQFRLKSSTITVEKLVISCHFVNTVAVPHEMFEVCDIGHYAFA